jgi:hypothetical protein
LDGTHYFFEKENNLKAYEKPRIKNTVALFVWTYQHNQQPSSSVFLSQQTSEQYFQHNKPAKRTG